jgi:hypothetical protein
LIKTAQTEKLKLNPYIQIIQQIKTKEKEDKI